MALLGIAKRDQNLPGGDLPVRKHLRPDSRQGDLADGGGGLAVFEFQVASGEAQHGPPERDRAGRNDEEIGALRVQIRDVLGKREEPASPDAALFAIDQQGGADLDDDAAEGFEARQGGGRRRRRLVCHAQGCHSATALGGTVLAF